MTSESELINYDRKAELARKVDAVMKTRTYHKKDKKCSQCGKSFEGTEKADVCGPTCRKRKSRAK